MHASTPILALAAGFAALLASNAAAQTTRPATTQPHATTSAPTTNITRRPFKPFIGDEWIGNGVSYGPQRDGQYPGRPPYPSTKEIREDAHIMAQHWKLVRMYGSEGAAEELANIIREDKLPMRLMVGAWITPEGDPNSAEFARARASNELQVDVATRLANDYPDVVLAVSIGNETQVFWSSHRIPPELLIKYIRRARAQTQAPVTTADDFNFWNKPESKAVAAEVDFIVTHVYAMWAGQPLDRGLPFTEEKYNEVKAMHADHVIVLGEAGWATMKHAGGEQAKLIKGPAGESEQATFYREYLPWVTKNRITNFYFEAFDEKWKGGDHPDEVEKHWGLYNSDRTPKAAIRELAKP